MAIVLRITLENGDILHSRSQVGCSSSRPCLLTLFALYITIPLSRDRGGESPYHIHKYGGNPPIIHSMDGTRTNSCIPITLSLLISVEVRFQVLTNLSGYPQGP